MMGIKLSKPDEGKVLKIASNVTTVLLKRKDILMPLKERTLS